MKFWVKAVVDNNTQEQLFVTATSKDELRSELEGLLNMSIASMSITDFQSQVVERVNAGEDIVTVNVRRQLATPGKRPSSDELRNHRPADLASQSFLNTSEDAGVFADGRPRHQRTPSVSANLAATPADRGRLSLNSSLLNLHAWSPMLGEGELGPSYTTSPAKLQKQHVLDVPPVEKVCLTREDIELLLAEPLGDRFWTIPNGCFVRIRDHQGYNVFQISHVDKDTDVKLVLDTVYSTEAVSLETVSNAEPTAAEVKKWVKKLITFSSAFPTRDFVEAKYSDVQSALSSARAALVASPTVAPRSEKDMTFTARSFEALKLETQVPLSPAVSEKEDHYTTPRNRRSVVQNQLTLSGIQGGKVSIKVNDALLHTAVCVQEGTLASRGSKLALLGTRHSNARSRKARVSDFAGFAMLLDDEQPSMDRDISFTTFNAMGSFDDPTLGLPTASRGTTVATLSDRDITAKGLALFAPPVAWGNRYLCLGQQCPTRHGADSAPYVMKEYTDDDEDDDMFAHAEDSAGRSTAALVQDYVVLSGPTLATLSPEETPASLPLPEWATNGGADASVCRPILVEHKGELHCFYLLRSSISRPTGTWSRGSSASKGRHHHHRKGLSGPPSVTAERYPLSGTATTSPVSAATQSLAKNYPVSTEHVDLAPAPALAGSAVDSSIAGAAGVPPVPQRQQTPPSRMTYRYGLAHAVATTVPEETRSSFADDAAQSPAGSRKDSMGIALGQRWRLLSCTAPIRACVSDAEPIFAAASIPAERGADDNLAATHGSSARGMPSRASSEARTPAEPCNVALNVLWHTTKSGALSTATTRPTTPSTSSAALQLQAAEMMSKEYGSSTVLSPGVARRRSPAVSSLQPTHTLGGRAELPFTRLVCAAPSSVDSAWEEDSFYSLVELSIENLVADIDSVSLFAKDSCVFLSTVSHHHGRVTIWSVPVTGEP